MHRDIFTLTDSEFPIALAGMEARKAGKRSIDNPHADSEGARAWRDGWHYQAEIEADERRAVEHMKQLV